MKKIYRILMTSALLISLCALTWLDSLLPSLSISHLPFSSHLYSENALFHGPVYIALGILVSIIAGIELSKLLSKNYHFSPLLAIIAITIGQSMPTKLHLIEDKEIAFLITMTVPIGLMFLSWLTLLGRRNIADLFHSFCMTLLAFFWIGLPLGFLLLTRQIIDSWEVFAILITIKSSDIGGWIFGNLFGKKKLIPWLSPQKTWEGLAGGVLLSSISALLLLPSCIELNSLELIFAGASIALLGQGGDLMMSTLKRHAEEKDSSSLIPSMGGILDILDSLLLTSPFIFWLIKK